MAEKTKGLQKNSTYIVKIMQTQNKSWQGSVTWVDKNETQYFRSALELIHMINDTVGQS